MQKTFKNQQGREILFVKVDNDYQTAKVYGNQLNYWTENHTYNDSLPTLIWLHKGNYQILCLAKDATEEQAAIVVDILWNGFKNYLTLDGNVGNYKRLVKSTAKESLTSLLTSLGFKQDDKVLILERI